MSKEGTDRRVRKTKKQLLLGLTSLMQEKSVKEITVRELSELVDINRGTFYLHYKDIYDMVEQIEKEMFEEFNQMLNKYPIKELDGKPLPMLIDVFRFIENNAEMCKVLLGKNGDIAFVNSLKDVVKERCLNDWIEIFNTQKAQNFEYFYSFIVSGCIGLLENWLQSGMKESAKEMAILAEEMIMKGIAVLKHK